MSVTRGSARNAAVGFALLITIEREQRPCQPPLNTPAAALRQARRRRPTGPAHCHARPSAADAWRYLRCASSMCHHHRKCISLPSLINSPRKKTAWPPMVANASRSIVAKPMRTTSRPAMPSRARGGRPIQCNSACTRRPASIAGRSNGGSDAASFASYRYGMRGAIHCAVSDTTTPRQR